MFVGAGADVDVHTVGSGGDMRRPVSANVAAIGDTPHTDVKAPFNDSEDTASAATAAAGDGDNDEREDESKDRVCVGIVITICDNDGSYNECTTPVVPSLS